jgi:hypothetical protein
LNLEDFRFPRSTTQGSENTSAKGNVPDGLDRVPRHYDLQSLSIVKIGEQRELLVPI